MGLKDDVRTWLVSRDDAALAAGVAADRRIVRHLVSRLWDDDPAIRRAAARGLGEVAVHHPDLALEVIRRFIWALNDESATQGGPVLAALGEMGRRVPSLVEPFIGALAALSEDGGLREDLIAALGAIATTAPALVAPHYAALRKAADTSRPGERDALAALGCALEGSR